MRDGRAVDRWAEREAAWTRMSDDERRAYVAGVSHAFGDTFTIISSVFVCRGNDLSDALEKLSARFEECINDFTVKGVL
jgi:hypothetical protein